MRFEALAPLGAFRIVTEPHVDTRGGFTRMWCVEEAARAGIAFAPLQWNASWNAAPLTLRGLHFQRAPHGEVKLVRCTRGRIFDAFVDLRPDSPTYLRWHGEELSAENHVQLFIPEGFAHGYLTLEPHSEVSYGVSAMYAPDAAEGVRWNDPAFGIAWPAVPEVLHPRDAAYRDYQS